MDSKEQLHKNNIQVIGHRGHVSHFPENSIEGFLSLSEMGADGLELDLVISADKEVVVSHEPYMAASYMLTPDGARIRKSEEKDHLLYKMTYDYIRRFDSGSLRNIRFPKQKNTVAYKPLLKEVFERVENCLKEKNGKSFTYYLELKSVPAEYGISQPYPEEFADLVMEVVKENQIPGQVVLKSFDANLLNVIHEKFPEARISYLLYKVQVEEGLALLNFKPEIISPHFRMLTNKEELLKLQEQVRVIVWTVNQQRHIRKMIDLGVDGIISDYPERVLKEKKIRFG